MGDPAPLYQSDAVGPKAYQLVELLKSIEGVLKRTFYGQYWVIAEVIDSGYHSGSGHWYMQLAQTEDGQQIAHIRANLWAGVASRVIPRFKSITGSTIQAGMELMLYVKVNMHPVYGLSLVVYDINPEYTLGHLERLKKETIKRLTEEGVIDLNKQIALPRFIRRVAVISSSTAAGWGDFLKQIKQSRVGALIKTDLYPATMQGENTTRSVLKALDHIAERMEEYDAVVLIRGGGSRMDLAAFDDYVLTCNLANYPLPIITGIGHERDESVADLVAHTALKTPTAVADFLLRGAEDALYRLLMAETKLEELLLQSQTSIQNAIHKNIYELRVTLAHIEMEATEQRHRHQQRIERLLHRRLEAGRSKIREAQFRTEQLTRRQLEKDKALARYTTTLTMVLSGVSSRLSESKNSVQLMTSQLRHFLSTMLTKEDARLSLLEQTAKLYDPTSIMARGYLPVTQNGRKVTKRDTLDFDRPIEVTLLDTRIKANIIQDNNENDKTL
ncbi:MAG: exodeoxyribonuclease VII large subunit [Porphyromonas sp.]|nr:exodeoxyribonuclease VII large subunit [Porphyromonas sp.]